MLSPVQLFAQILQSGILGWVASSPGDLPYPGIEPGSPGSNTELLHNVWDTAGFIGY